MSPSRRVGSGDEKKGESSKPVPRPGTMAHLRYVEERKRKETDPQKPDKASTSEPAETSPVDTSTIGGHKETLPKKEVCEEIGVKAHAMIHGAAVAAAAVGGGLAQIPVSGSLVITPIQISMIIALGSLHGKTLDKSAALGVLAAAYGPLVGRTVSQFLVGWIPGLGNLINAATAFVITESIGWSAHKILSND
jgi:uncharacterized protein (DUF697 family)